MLPTAIGIKISDLSRYAVGANIQRRSFFAANPPKVSSYEEGLQSTFIEVLPNRMFKEESKKM